VYTVGAWVSYSAAVQIVRGRQMRLLCAVASSSIHSPAAQTAHSPQKMPLP
jgi:hypothetical protein